MEFICRKPFGHHGISRIDVQCLRSSSWPFPSGLPAPRSATSTAMRISFERSAASLRCSARLSVRNVPPLDNRAALHRYAPQLPPGRRAPQPSARVSNRHASVCRLLSAGPLPAPRPRWRPAQSSRPQIAQPIATQTDRWSQALVVSHASSLTLVYPFYRDVSAGTRAT